jgi:hypothetical protein
LNQNAPSVDYPVGRFFWATYVPVGLAMLSFLALSASLVVGLFEGWRAALLFGAWVLLTFFSVYSLKSRLAQSWLCWDGHDWQVQTVLSLATQSVSVAPSPAPSTHLNQPLIGSPLDGGYAIRVHLDFQQYLFVSLLNATFRTQWFWVAKRSFPERWHGFRCAVYSQSE